MKRFKNVEDKNEEQLKKIKNQGEKQIKIVNQNKIKAPLLKSIYNRELRKGNIDNDEAIRIFKNLENLEGKEIGYNNLVYKSGDNEYFDFGKYGPLSSLYLRLVEGNISFKKAKLSLKEFIAEMNRLEKKKAKNHPILYKGMNLIIDVFEDNVFVYPYCFAARPNHELSGSNQNKGTFDSEFYTPEEAPRDMSSLESEESAKNRRNQRETGLKILPPDQMLSRLPIILAQLKVENDF